MCLLKDQSRLYTAMTIFYASPDDKCKLHKRRLDLLSETLGPSFCPPPPTRVSAFADGFNEKAYPGVCRQLAFELGEITNEMASLKLEALEARNVDGKRSIEPPSSLLQPHLRALYRAAHAPRGGQGQLPLRPGSFTPPFPSRISIVA